MIKKDDYLKINNPIKIKSYNYEESKGFSQETAVDTSTGIYKEHKFIIEINDTNYSLEFENATIINKYAAMEDEWVEIENTSNKNKLTIKEIKGQNLHRGIPETIFYIENISEDIKYFKDLLIKTAKEIGVGCDYNDHMNTEDDFARIFPDTESHKFFYTSSEDLFIEDNEKSFFEDFIKIKKADAEKAFLCIVEKEIIKEKEDKQKEEKAKRVEEIALIVNPIFKEIMDVCNDIHHIEHYVPFNYS